MTLPDREQIRQELRRIHEKQSDVGLLRMISGHLFEPPNIFDPGARPRPKPELLIILSYVLLMAGVWAAFRLK
jgi:hypothetical protein